MLYRILIFLLLCSVVLAADLYCYTGGSAAAIDHAGFSRLEAATSVGTNGESVATGTGAATYDGVQWVVITDTDAFDDAVVGMYVYCDFAEDTHADGRYEIIDIVANDDIKIELAYIGDEAVDWVLGGALPIVHATDGLQYVLDHAYSSAAAQNVDIYVAGSDTATATIVADVGGGATAGTLKRVIGVNTSYVADGTYAVITVDSADLAGGPVIQVDDISYIIFENIHVIVSGDAATAGEDGFQAFNGAARSMVSFYNCKATDAYIGFNLWGSSQGVTYPQFISCISVGSVLYGLKTHGNGAQIRDCYIETAGTAGAYIGIVHGGVCEGCIIDSSGASGIYFAQSLTGFTVKNCDFYNQTTACLNAAVAKDMSVTAYNNLFWVADINADFPILNTAGVIFTLYEDYNFTNADATRASMLTGANSGNTLWSDTETNLWTDAANNDFTVTDAAMIDGGRPTLSDEGGTPADGYSTPGAAQLAQTQAGGGGGVFPQRIERRGD